MRRYLIVDDNEALAENLQEILEDRGDEAVIAASGEEALERVRTGRFDVVITDMRMPAMGGGELLGRLRQIDPGFAAVVITAHTSDTELERARLEGILAVLPKPVPLPQLLELLEHARRDGVVALVEDDQALSDNLTEALRDRGFSPVTAGSVEETGRLPRPFAALVDVRVPGGPDGEAARRLGSRFPGTPLVVITALPATPDVGADRTFQKPFDTRALLEAIEALHAGREEGS